jgi:hypothetical protein
MSFLSGRYGIPGFFIHLFSIKIMDNQEGKIRKSLFFSEYVYKFTACNLSLNSLGAFPLFLDLNI